MSGSTLFRPEDRLAWYADWLKFLQEREAELRTQLARQEKSTRKVEVPPEAGIAFVSDQPASFLQIAFGEQAATPTAGDASAALAEEVAATTADEGGPARSQLAKAGAEVSAEADSDEEASDDAGAGLSDQPDEDAQGDTDLATDESLTEIPGLVENQLQPPTPPIVDDLA